MLLNKTQTSINLKPYLFTRMGRIPQKGKIILVNGAPLELTKIHNKAFYFDQRAVLTENLGITEVPIVVRQQDKHLLIETIPVSKRQNYE